MTAGTAAGFAALAVATVATLVIGFFAARESLRNGRDGDR